MAVLLGRPSRAAGAGEVVAEPVAVAGGFVTGRLSVARSSAAMLNITKQAKTAICIWNRIRRVALPEDGTGHQIPPSGTPSSEIARVSRACHPVVVETTTGLHPCARIVCHDGIVELKTELGEIELFRYDNIIDVSPMMSLAQIANKADFSVVEEESGKILPFPHAGNTARPNCICGCLTSSLPEGARTRDEVTSCAATLAY